MQRLGGGRSEATTVAVMLDLCPSALLSQFSEIEEHVALEERRRGIEQLKENVELEISLTPPDENGDIGIDVAGDTRWDKRGTGRQYNSDSGLQSIFGLRCKNIIAGCSMS